MMCLCDQLRKLVAQVRPVGRMSLEPWSVMRSWIFRIITPVFSVTWSSEIILICWFAAQETFLIISNVENSSAAS